MLNVGKSKYLITNLFKSYKISSKFCPRGGDFIKKFVLGFLNEKFSGPGVSPGGGGGLKMITSHGDTCINRK